MTIVSTEVVEVRRTFAAPREKVFEAWISPKMMPRWFGRGSKEQKETKVVEVDARPGGQYRVEVTSPDGKVYKMSGTYREVVPPEKLVFTWSWEGADFQTSEVHVEFRTLGQSNFTEVVLRHSLLPEKWREDHRQGWNACFNMLEQVAQA